MDTALALFAAHLITDSLPMKRRAPFDCLRNIAVLIGCTVLLTGQLWHTGIAVFLLARVTTEIGRCYLYADTIKPFVLYQLASTAAVALGSIVWPALFSDGIWANPPPGTPITFPHSNLEAYLNLLAVAVGFWTAVVVGGEGIRRFVAGLGFQEDPQNKGLADGGKYIGWFERALVFVLVLVGQVEAIGFLVAAKSLLRMNTTNNERKATEYIIIGTLISFGWALCVGLATQHLLKGLA